MPYSMPLAVHLGERRRETEVELPRPHPEARAEKKWPASWMSTRNASPRMATSRLMRAPHRGAARLGVRPVQLVEVARRRPSAQRARRSTGSAIPRNGIRPSRNARLPPRSRRCTRTDTCRPPAGLAREPQQRERLEVGLVELERRARRRSSGAPASRRARGTSARTRSAPACPGSRGARARRRRGSGRGAWTIEVGWMTTSILSYGSPKRKCASISSSPLFASVAESTVIFGPIRQVGCASASSGVTSASSSRVRPRNGPPEAVRTTESTFSVRRPSRHWNSAPSARCRPGSSRPPPRSRAASASSPAATRLSLFASASVTPRSSAQSVAGSPAKPTTAFRTTSGSARSSSSVGSPPTCVSGASPSIGWRARARRHELELGIRVDDLERLAPDRAGGTREGDALHRVCPRV